MRRKASSEAAWGAPNDAEFTARAGVGAQNCLPITKLGLKMPPNRDVLYRYKGNRCACCGVAVKEMLDRWGTFNRMFQFHHINPSSKDREYKKLIAKRLSRRQADELDKCVLLCTQCHATLHAQEIKAKLTLQVDLGTRIVSQTMDGWVRADFQEQRLKFITNQRFMLRPCLVFLAGNEPITLCPIEILSEQHLLNWLDNIATLKSMVIGDPYLNVQWASLQYQNDGRVRCTQRIEFPLFLMEFQVTDPQPETVLLRHGAFLSSSGEVHFKGEVSFVYDHVIPGRIEP